MYVRTYAHSHHLAVHVNCVVVHQMGSTRGTVQLRARNKICTCGSIFDIVFPVAYIMLYMWALYTKDF